jgi:branched-subunit amino acid aminotransferase/4-amino-4-deoxychorismate lyase
MGDVDVIGREPAGAIVNGRPSALADAKLAITDDGAARGDGAFETVGVWGGNPFRLRDHLARLNTSLAAIRLEPVDPELLAEEAASLLTSVDGDAVLRIYVTAAGTRVLYVAEQPQRRAPQHLITQPAPWIRPTDSYGPAGAKTMSYGANMAATRAAQAAGGDDALLVSLEGYVLEGSTFAVLWVVGGRLYAMPPELGIVDSISRRTLLDIAAADGIPTAVEACRLDQVLAADEVVACSAVRDAIAVKRIDDTELPAGTPVRDVLALRLNALRREGG